MKTAGSIGIKTPQEIAVLHEGGQILAAITEELARSFKEGMTTREIDRQAGMLIRDRAVLPAFQGYRGFPGCVCISVNEEVVHGLPGDRRLKDGDIVSLDAGIIYKNYYVDTAVTVGIGDISPVIRRLLEVTRQSLFLGIVQARAGNHLSDISHAVQVFVEANGFSVVRDFVGHGIGRNLHEDPEIPNFGQAHEGPVLKEGMVLAIEPMVNAGGWQTRVLPDGWTVVTQDGKPSAHFEHTVAVTADAPMILTQRHG